MLAPFSNYPVNQAFERLMAEERAERAAHPSPSLMQRIASALLGARWTPAHVA
ncbi:Ribbon-helix-helix protein CopG domain-containing protein OS=Castellaniella defragrans OX=75697 GN=HNR28_001470 PE=4 SV=1 [Castellaniella defragrans]